MHKRRRRLDMPVPLRSEPRGETYRALLRFALKHCASFSLVWRDEMWNDAAARIEAELRPFLIREEHTNSWLGTVVYAPPCAMVRFYRLTPESCAILARAPSLYSWIHPDLPEDLTIFEAEGHPWLCSISHEEDGYLEPLLFPKGELRRAIPDLDIYWDYDKYVVP
jgi:hypothetical protein